MKKAFKLAPFLLLAALLFAVPAFALDVTVSNRLDTKLAITLTYYDADSGTLVTKAWWHVEPQLDLVVSVNADESRGIYYAAYNKDQFVDSSTKGNEQIWRWASPKNFEYATDEEPLDPGVWKGRFYKANGTSIEVNARPR